MNYKKHIVNALLFMMIAVIPTAFAALPDLEITQIQMVSDCKIDITITNNGSAGLLATDYAKITVALYLDGSPYGGLALSSYASGGSLSVPGGTLVLQKFLSKQVPDGLHVVEARIDPLNYVPEENDNNNTRSESFTGNCGYAVAGKPDVKVHELEMAAGCKIKVTLKNIGVGGVPTSGFTGSALHLYKNNSILASSNLGTADPSKLLSSPGSTAKFTFPQTVPVGTNSYKVKLNPSYIDDGNLNNSLTKTLECKASISGIQSGGGSSNLPDLIVKQIQMVGNCKFDITIQNIGSVGLQTADYRKITVQLYLDGKAFGGKSLSSYASGGALSVPNGMLVLQKIMNKQIPDGTHNLEVRLDPLNFVPEANDSNNNKSESVTGNCGIVQQGKPDVKMEDFKLVGNCRVQVTLKNLGPGPVPNSGYSGSSIFIYKDNNIFASRKLNELDPQKLLKPAGGQVTYTYQQAPDLGPGSHQMTARFTPSFIDKTNVNNVLNKTLVCKAPDLTIIDMREIRIITKSRMRKFLVTVRNIGTGKAKSSVLKVQLGMGMRDLRYPVPSLSAGASRQITISLDLKRARRCEVLLTVDPDNRIEELREDNNTFRKGIAVAAPSAPVKRRRR